MIWIGALLAIAIILAAVSGALGGRLALFGSFSGFLLGRVSVGSLTGEANLWYLVFVPCLIFMLLSAGLAALLSRKWRRN